MDPTCCMLGGNETQTSKLVMDIQLKCECECQCEYPHHEQTNALPNEKNQCISTCQVVNQPMATAMESTLLPFAKPRLIATTVQIRAEAGIVSLFYIGTVPVFARMPKQHFPIQSFPLSHRLVRPWTDVMYVHLVGIVLAGQNQNPQAHAVFVSILRAETPQDAHCICGMCVHSVVWSIHRDCISSFAFWLNPANI